MILHFVVNKIHKICLKNAKIAKNIERILNYPKIVIYFCDFFYCLIYQHQKYNCGPIGQYMMPNLVFRIFGQTFCGNSSPKS